MPVFKYKAYTKERKLMSGLVDAPAENLAIQILKDKEFDIVSIAEKKNIFGAKNIVIGGVKVKDVVIFSRQFSVLISSSISLVQSLKMLSEQTKNPVFRNYLSEISDEVDGGARLSDALAKRPKAFSEFYVSVVRSGETSGKLDEVLTYLADELEKDYDMMSKIKGAMIYPAFIFFGLAIVGTAMMVFVVPKLTGVIAELGGELPTPTKVLIFASDFLAAFWWLLLIALVGAIVGFKMAMKTKQGKDIFGIILLNTPIFGKLFRKIYLVRFTRSLETLIKGGVSISQGLKITADVVSNAIFKDLILETKKAVEDGKSMISAMEDSRYVSSMVTQMIGVGEKTGQLDGIFGSITIFYSREIDNTVANLMTLLEPIIMVIIGIAVGGMVAAIIMPMYNMASQY
ncbi:MAG: type II secretion system F family protein [Patescibacteria group bacterium]|nr:type II secretion system F family protein [Patescibacteria group bacterium]